MELQEAITALITPFHNGAVDYSGLKANIDFQVEHGISSLLLLGSTGEMQTLTDDELSSLVLFAKDVIDSRVPLMVNVSFASTAKAVEFAKFAKESGANKLLLAPPPYLCPSDEGIIAHFEAVLSATDLPVMLYNIPKRTSVDVSEAVARHFAGRDTICGIKEASGNLQTLLMLSEYFTVYAGNDAEYIAAKACGAKGLVSVISNLDPALIVDLVQNDNIEAHKEVLRLSRSLSCGPNPVPIKAAMSLKGMAAGDVRLPLVPLLDEALHKVAEGLGAETV